MVDGWCKRRQYNRCWRLTSRGRDVIVATVMDTTKWQFWIDVGGTFTDCLGVRPDSTVLRHKVLSSAVTKGVVAAGGGVDRISTHLGGGDDFWRGYGLQLLDRDGKVVDSASVARFDSGAGTLKFARPLSVAAQTGQAFELTSSEEAPILAIRQLMNLRLDQPIPPVVVRLGTTRGTNALITRRGAKTALVTTRGFADILHIGYQNRPRLFDLAIKKPPPLFAAVAEIDERISAEGEILLAADETQIRGELLRLREQAFESLAICLLNAHVQPRHEEIIERIARDVGFEEISVSSRVAPLIKIVSRGDTTVVDAYLNPVLRRYVAKLREALGDESELRLLTSAGGLVDAQSFVGKDSILSGPAGGVVGFSRVAEAAGFDRAIGFDMGGTSTDVSRFDGQFEMEYETEKAGVRVVAPMMAIETVAAGGGSICRFDGVKLAVGPDSAGADPGPLCYGRGGPLTVTDINLFLGKILPDEFPFSLLPRSVIESQLNELCDEIQENAAARYSAVELADGFLRVANANMAQAIRSISIAKGYDPRDYVLVAFGGAAAQHACAIARELGIESILNHPDAGVLSARGIGMADVVRHRAEGVYRPYDESALADLRAAFDRLSNEATREVIAEGISPEQVEVRRLLDLRYRGLDAFLTVAEPDDGDFARQYASQHQRLYGYINADRELEIVAARVEVIGRAPTNLEPSGRVTATTPKPASTTEMYFAGESLAANVFRRSALNPGDRIDGPAIVLEDLSTTVIDPGWQADVLSQGELLLTAVAASDSRRAMEDDVNVDRPDPITLELFNNHFAGIAEQMGITLRNTASSVNVKERLDFSCALFTPTGDLVVNAPHIPVHLGAMSETVRGVIADNPSLRPGDVFVTNDPFNGGSHLPDITVVTPVHDRESARLQFFTASRAHHAEIGGISPGSMPPFSTNLAEEGVLIRNFKVVAGGQSRTDELRELLLDGSFPTRGVEDNLADLSAQIAANEQGARDLTTLIDRYSWPVVSAYMNHIQAAAETKMRMALSRIPDGDHKFRDHLDDGTPIEVTITVAGDSATIDFAGTGPVLPGNLNANRAIVTAAVMYCLRLLIDEDIPLNQGVLAPVEIVLPECCLNPPRRESPEQCAAVAGGNVETSQRVVDVLLGAFGVAAASQGTMNNLLFGNPSFGYYETICGGSGATAEHDGADAAHTHMTNTRLTDPEVIEQRYPVRVREFAIRRGSGGAGKHRGGDGVVRKLEFLRALDVSILSQRRGPHSPYGLQEGSPGDCGVNTLHRADGTTQRLPALTQFTAQPGDVLTIETPGGGGFGQSAD